MRYSIIIKVILLISIIIFAYSLINRQPDIDDAWLGEHAYWQAKLGYVKSELMHGITLQEERLISHHKLLTLQGALFINFFGFSLLTLKSLSLIYFCIFLLIFYLYSYTIEFSSTEFLLSVLLIVSNSLIFRYSFVFRPEIPVMTMGFISYYFINKVLNDSKHSVLFAALSGLCSGFCVSTHLNGIIFIVAGFLLLLWNRKYLHWLVFGLSTIPSALIYFYDFTSKYNFKFWLYQIINSPSIDRIYNLPLGISNLFELLNEHMRFFHSPIEISFTVLLLVVLILMHKHLKQKKNLIRYTMLLLISLALFSVNKTTKYIILYLPYLIILITLSVKYLFDKSLLQTIIIRKFTHKKAIPLVVGLLTIYLVVNMYYNVQLSIDKFDTTSNQNIVKTYFKENTDSCRIIAPMTFVFDEINNYKLITAELCYTEMQKSNKSIFKCGFLKLAEVNKIDYIILSPYFIQKLGMDCLSDIDCYRNDFEVLLRRKDLLILKRSKGLDAI
jgi:hypothetical protein